ncbi:MAG TPA: hypothetical protein VJN69_14410 [Candidatus Acidoferrales bacterium]|nr:hypothetical protein [Candidatus Acidoferrales bacterium]
MKCRSPTHFARTNLESLQMAGTTGLEPATSAVTGRFRDSNDDEDDWIYGLS